MSEERKDGSVGGKGEEKEKGWRLKKERCKKGCKDVRMRMRMRMRMERREERWEQREREPIDGEEGRTGRRGTKDSEKVQYTSCKDR